MAPAIPLQSAFIFPYARALILLQEETPTATQ